MSLLICQAFEIINQFERNTNFISFDITSIAHPEGRATQSLDSNKSYTSIIFFSGVRLLRDYAGDHTKVASKKVGDSNNKLSHIVQI